MKKADDGIPAAALEVAIEAGKAAGEIIVQRFSKISAIRYKGRANPVTDVDLMAEETVVGMLSQHFPEHNILSEEERSIDHGSAFTWVIDPLDGTRNFTQAIPYVAVSIALVHGGMPVVGVVYDPVRNETFSARLGHGAFLNGTRIAVSQKANLSDAFVGMDLGYDEEARKRGLEAMLAVRPKTQAFRLFGSAVLGLAYVACGRLDVYCHPQLYPWDIMGSAMLIKEAGGQITDLGGREISLQTGNIIAGSGRLYQPFYDLAADLLRERRES